MARKLKAKDLKAFSMLGYLGFVIVINIAVGAIMGYYLDKWLGISPVLTILFLMFGIMNAFRSMFRMVNEVSK